MFPNSICWVLKPIDIQTQSRAVQNMFINNFKKIAYFLANYRKHCALTEEPLQKPVGCTTKKQSSKNLNAKIEGDSLLRTTICHCQRQSDSTVLVRGKVQVNMNIFFLYNS